MDAACAVAAALGVPSTAATIPSPEHLSKNLALALSRMSILLHLHSLHRTRTRPSGTSRSPIHKPRTSQRSPRNLHPTVRNISRLRLAQVRDDARYVKNALKWLVTTARENNEMKEFRHRGLLLVAVMERREKWCEKVLRQMERERGIECGEGEGERGGREDDGVESVV